MTQAHLLHDLDEYVLWFAFTASLVFTPLMSLIWPWWRHAWGVNIVTLEIAIAVALLIPWLRLVFRLDGLAFQWIQLAAVTYVGLVIMWRMALIWRGQRDGALRDRELTARQPGTRRGTAQAVPLFASAG